MRCGQTKLHSEYTYAEHPWTICKTQLGKSWSTEQ